MSILGKFELTWCVVTNCEVIVGMWDFNSIIARTSLLWMSNWPAQMNAGREALMKGHLNHLDMTHLPLLCSTLWYLESIETGGF